MAQHSYSHSYRFDKKKQLQGKYQQALIGIIPAAPEAMQVPL